MQTLSCKQDMQITCANSYFSLTDHPIFLEINRVHTVDDIYKQCKFQENLTTNADGIA